MKKILFASVLLFAGAAFSYSQPTRITPIPLDPTAAYGVERAPVLTAATWTCGAGWDCSVSGTLNKNGDGTGTAAPTTAPTIAAGVSYRVVITVGAVTVGNGATYTLGGTAAPAALNAAGTYTHDIVATNTTSLIITPTPTATRFTITAVSIKVMENATRGTAHYSSGTSGISASDANTNTTFKNNHSGGDSLAFLAQYVWARNRGANVVHLDLGDGVATTADTRIEAGQGFTISAASVGSSGFEAVGLICGSGLTTTVDLDAW